MKSKIKIIIISALFVIVGVFFGIIAHVNSAGAKTMDFSGDTDETTDIIIIDEDEIETIDSYTSKDVVKISLGKVTTCNAFEVTTTGQSNALTFGITANVKISNHRIIKNNEAFIECISESNMGIGTAGSQRFFSGDNVCIRNTKTVQDLKPDYTDKETNVINKEQYKEKYGWLPYQMNGYIINDSTYLEDPTIVDNGNSTYKLTVKLDPNSDAAFYYKREVATNAETTYEPVFKKIEMEITINSNYVIQEVKIHEEYQVTVDMGFLGKITSDTTTETVDTYNYNNVSFDEDLYNYYKGKLSA